MQTNSIRATILFRVLTFVASFFLSIIAILLPGLECLRVPIFAATVIVSVLIVLQVRNNCILFLISSLMAYANYSACLMNTIPPYLGYEAGYVAEPASLKAMALLLLFNSILLVTLPNKIIKFRSNTLWTQHQSNWSGPLIALLSIMLVVIFFTCSSGFDSVDGRASNNSIFEYSYILFIIGYLYSGEKKSFRLILSAIAFLYFMQAFFGGNRASVIAIALLLFIVFVADKFTWKSLLPFLLLGILLMQGIGYFRNSPGGLDNFSLINTAAITFSNGLNWDTASYAFHQSIAFVKLEDLVSFEDHLYLLVQWLQSCLVGAGLIPDSNLAIIAQQHYPGMGGGFLPIYFNFYMGIPGVVLSALIVSYWFKRIAMLGDERSGFKSALTLGVSITFLRWYLYSPSPLTSGIVFLSIAYFIVQFLFSYRRNCTRNQI